MSAPFAIRSSCLSAIVPASLARAGLWCWSRRRRVRPDARRAVRLICTDPGGRRTGFRLSARCLGSSVTARRLLIAESRMRWRGAGCPPPPRPTSCWNELNRRWRPPSRSPQAHARRRQRRGSGACRALRRGAARYGAAAAAPARRSRRRAGAGSPGGGRARARARDAGGSARPPRRAVAARALSPTW